MIAPRDDQIVRRRSPGVDLPLQCGCSLIFSDTGFKEVLLFDQVDGFAHPGERILGMITGLETNAFEATVSNMADIIAEHVRIEPEDTSWQAVNGVLDLQLFPPVPAFS